MNKYALTDDWEEFHNELLNFAKKDFKETFGVLSIEQIEEMFYPKEFVNFTDVEHYTDYDDFNTPEIYDTP